MAGRLILLFCSVVAALFALEVGCRAVRGRYLLIHWPNLVLEIRESSARFNQTTMSADPELGYAPRIGFTPHGSEIGPVGKHDAHGMRLMPPLENVAKRPLILATGDSYTYGAEVSEAETWPAYLQGLLRVNVANGGVIAYGLDQIVLRSERLARELRPDALVLSFIADDLRRNELSRYVGFEKPYFAKEGNKLVLQHVPVPTPPSPWQTLSFWERSLGWSVLLEMVLLRLDWPEDWPYDSVRVQPRGAGADVACLLMQRVAALSIPTLVVAQYEDVWLANTGAMQEHRRLSAATLRCAREAGLETLDTFDAISAARGRDPVNHLFAPEGHLNAIGNQVIAETIAAKLRPPAK
jgi:lysophospholipase L1-like esterase